MKRRCIVRAAALGLVTASLGCQELRPAAPTAASLFVTSANVEGVWNGSMTRVQSYGGGCAGEVIETFLPTNDFGTLSMAQDGTTLSATLTMESTGLACRYVGSASGTSIALNATSCDRTGLLVECPTGPVRLQLVGSSVTGNRAGSAVTGTSSSTYNVFDADSGDPLGALVAGHTFSVTRQ
jgi:hypothetical protein